MGRKAGGKNFGNFDTEPKQTVTEKAIAAGEISEADRARLPEIFTCIKKDFNECNYYGYLGETVFLTREAAEARLKELEEKCERK